MNLKAKDGKYLISYLSIKELKGLIRISKVLRDDLIISILYETGCTVSELVNIRIVDFDFEKNRLTIEWENARNNQTRQVYISNNLIMKIKEYIKENPHREYLFYTRQSPQMTTKRICQLVKKYCILSGLKEFTPQILRYTHIVHAYQKKIPLDAIQRQVGLKRSRAIEIFSQLPELVTENAYRNFIE